MDPEMHPKFDMVMLESESKPFTLGLPLCNDDFTRMMKTEAIMHEFKSIALSFRSHRGTPSDTMYSIGGMADICIDLLDFRRTYLGLRRDWLGMTGQVE
jgi:hypothetical protein